MDYKIGALYIRVSTDKQEELSPDAQKRLGLEFAKKNGILIKDEFIFIENGISGRKADKRPEFQRMISIAKSKPTPFQVIVVWKFSRFARNQEESIVYKSILRKQCGIDIVSISEPLIEGPFGSLIERIIEWMDEYYSINLSGEVVRGMTENAMRGGYQSTPCFGYQSIKTGQPFTVVPDQAEIVKYIFDQYCNENRDETWIARSINEKGIRTRRGNLFERRNIAYILQNRFYIGKLVWNGIECDGKHETFISEDLFNHAQEITRSTYRPIKSRNVSANKHWLSGIVKCGYCGASLCYTSSNKTSTHRYFQCWKYSKGYHKGSCGIREDQLISSVLSYFEAIFSGEEFSFHQDPVVKVDSSEENLLKMELDRIITREQRVRYAYENGIDSLEEYAENKKRIQQEKKRIEDLLSDLTATSPVITKDQFIERLRIVYDAIKDESVDYDRKGFLFRSVVRKITYDKEFNSFDFTLYYG